jgi:hypothetical protein
MQGDRAFDFVLEQRVRHTVRGMHIALVLDGEPILAQSPSPFLSTPRWICRTDPDHERHGQPGPAAWHRH